MAAFPHASEQRPKHPQSAVKQHQNTQRGPETDAGPGNLPISTDVTTLTRVPQPGSKVAQINTPHHDPDMMLIWVVSQPDGLIS